MRISDWSSDVCSSDLFAGILNSLGSEVTLLNRTHTILRSYDAELTAKLVDIYRARGIKLLFSTSLVGAERDVHGRIAMELSNGDHLVADALMFAVGRSPNITALGLDEVGVAPGPNDGVTVDAENRSSAAHTSALQSLMRISSAVFCLKKKKQNTRRNK